MTTDYTQTFEHEGVQVQLHRGTVRSSMESKRLKQALLRAYGHFPGNPASDDDAANMDEYAEAVSRSTTDAPWWACSKMSDEEVRQRYELFLAQPNDLYNKFILASGVIVLALEAAKLPQAKPRSGRKQHRQAVNNG